MTTLGIFFSLCCCLLFLHMADASLFNVEKSLKTYKFIKPCMEVQLKTFKQKKGVKKELAELEAVCEEPKKYVKCLEEEQKKYKKSGSDKSVMLEYFDFDDMTEIYKRFCEKHEKAVEEIVDCFEPTEASEDCAEAYKKNSTKVEDRKTGCRNTESFFTCLEDAREECDHKAKKFTKEIQSVLAAKKCGSKKMHISRHSHRASQDAALSVKGSLGFVSALLLALKAFSF